MQWGRKKADEIGAYSKAKPSSKDAPKDAKPDKPKKGSSFLSFTSTKPKSKALPKPPSYTDGCDLPPSDDENRDYSSEEELQENGIQKQPAWNQNAKPLEIIITDKEKKKRDKKDMVAAQAAELDKQAALKDDPDVFTVVIGSRASVLDGQDEGSSNVKDITVDNFSASV